MLWYCIDCNTVAKEEHFKGSCLRCPKCGGEDVFEVELFRGSYCGQNIPQEDFDRRIKAGNNCPHCEWQKKCKVEDRKPLPKANFP